MSKKTLNKKGLFKYYDDMFRALGYVEFIEFLVDRRIDGDIDNTVTLKQIFAITEQYKDHPKMINMLRDEIKSDIKEIPTWKF